MTESKIDALFGLLDAWRHLPAYRLEPRADPFFALYLQEVVTAHTGVRLKPIIVPEFPLRLGSVWADESPQRNQSVKVDYVLTSEDDSVVFLVELKTDQTSRRDKQDRYLKQACEVGLAPLIQGIVDIAGVTPSKYVRKYLYLLNELVRLGWVEVPPAVFAHAFPRPRPGLSAALRNIRVHLQPPGPQLKTLYIQPAIREDSPDDVISFEQFAATVEAHGDPVSLTFAAHLRRWSTPAATVRPAAPAHEATRRERELS